MSIAVLYAIVKAPAIAKAGVARSPNFTIAEERPGLLSSLPRYRPIVFIPLAYGFEVLLGDGSGHLAGSGALAVSQGGDQLYSACID